MPSPPHHLRCQKESQSLMTTQSAEEPGNRDHLTLTSSPARAAEAPCGASPSCRTPPEPGRQPSPARPPCGRTHDPQPPAHSDLSHRAASAVGATRAHQGCDRHTGGKIPAPTPRGVPKAREQGPMPSAIAATPPGNPRIPTHHADAQPIAISEIPIDAVDADPLVRAWAVVGRRPIITRQSSRSPASEKFRRAPTATASPWTVMTNRLSWSPP